MKTTLKPLAIAIISTLLPAPLLAASIETDTGWSADIGLQLQAFAIQTDNDTPAESGEENSFRIQSGFDPSKLTVSIGAPEVNGLKVGGTFQLVTNITDGKTEGSPDGGNLFGVRVAELTVSGDFGTVKAGRGWQIMGSHSLLHNTSSLPGVGGTSAGACGDFDGNEVKFSGGCGFIGYGYVWTNFASGIQYASPNYDGFSFRVGVFEPLGGKESSTPRIEGEVAYNQDAFDIWASFVNQDAGADGDISAIDVGAEGRFGGLAITATYTTGDGIDYGFRSPSMNESTFYAVEVDYTINQSTFGISLGSAELNDQADQNIYESDISTVFVHHNLTPYLTLVGEWVNEDVKGSREIAHFAVGAQLMF
ncbi:porin [Alteromonas sp. ZYF713]|nr:porin [Alteromonas sp. ZYF713]